MPRPKKSSSTLCRVCGTCSIKLDSTNTGALGWLQPHCNECTIKKRSLENNEVKILSEKEIIECCEKISEELKEQLKNFRKEIRESILVGKLLSPEEIVERFEKMSKEMELTSSDHKKKMDLIRDAKKN